ncbi:putative SP-containing membrane protein [Vairimorpha necatrix]|uniref:SP-containing membrane protein n=1 Tax=Vairimorpha necatrix TaxID=6039 RepID=A0AAX4JHN6_9MICR
MQIFLLISFIFTKTQINFPVEDNKHYAIVFFESPIFIHDYSIMYSKLDGKEENFVCEVREAVGKTCSEIKVPLSLIQNPRVERMYGIKITYEKEGKQDTMYAESFRYNEKTRTWSVSRAFEDDPWYIKNLYYIVGGSAFLAVALGGYLLIRKKRQDNIETM